MLERAFETFKAHDRPADAHHRGQPHRLRRAGQAGHHAAHGEPLGEEEIQRDQASSTAGPTDAKFLVPDGVYEHFQQGIGKRGKELRDAWFGEVRGVQASSIPSWPTSSSRCSTASCPTAGTRTCQPFPADPKGMAGRDSLAARCSTSLRQERALADRRLGRPGAVDQDAADLRGRRRLRGRQLRRPQLPLRHPRARDGRHPQRHGAVEGAALRLRLPDLQRLRPDADPPGAIMEIPVIYIFTHDSIGVGEDGPTHQPIEQLPSLRAIPGLIVLRPGDANEVVEAWKVIMQLQHEPAVPDPHAPGPADARPHQVRPGVGRAPRAPTSWPTPPAASRTCSCWRPAARCRCASRPTSS